MEFRSPHPTDDFDEALALVQAYDRAVYGDSDWTEAELREEWDGLDLTTDAWAAVDGGKVVGLMHVYDRRGGRVLADGYVHPDFTGRGIGSRLLEAAEQRALELDGDVPAGEALTLESAHLVGDPTAPMLFEGRNYERVRTFLRMIGDLRGRTSDPVWPDGLELRAFEPERHGRLVQATVDEAFADEWGYEQRAYEEWRSHTLEVESFDPDLCPVVWDGDEIAAVSINYTKRNGDWGWIGTVAVRPAWRRRGLGLALLHESFRRFVDRGEIAVALGVDSENPTGATKLYERAGMRVLWRADVWRKELRA